MVSSNQMKDQQATDAADAFTGKLVVAPRFHRQWMLSGNPALFVDRLIREHGDFVRCSGIIDFHLINHPSLVREVMRGTMRDFDKNTIIYNHFRNVFGNGLVTAEGEAWKRKRKLMQPMFSSGAIGSYFDLMVESATACAERIPVGEVFDMADEMNHLTLEIAGRAFFSDSFHGSIERIRKWTEAINRYSAKPPLPFVSDLRFPSPTNLRVRRMMEDFREFMRGLIEARAGSESDKDLLGVILSARDEDGEKMDADEVCEEILGMIIGGHETSATALTWLWYELHHHPKVERDILAEINSVVGDAPLTTAHLGELKLTNMAIQETMRLHPPFWFENRNAMSDIELGGTVIPRGSMVVFSRYSLQRHPDFWENPDSFDPSRFDPSNTANPGATCAHIPFGGGPRICIGRHFAMMEMLVIAVTILQRFRVSVHPTDRHRMSAKLTMAPRHGLRVTANKRS
jgi:cytochrome P450